MNRQVCLKEKATDERSAKKQRLAKRLGGGRDQQWHLYRKLKPLDYGEFISSTISSPSITVLQLIPKQPIDLSWKLVISVFWCVISYLSEISMCLLTSPLDTQQETAWVHST